MKRNILLLTAVVLAAVMLTGCIGPLAKVEVKVPAEIKITKEVGETDKAFVVATVEPASFKAKKKDLVTFKVTYVTETKDEKLAFDSKTMKIEFGAEGVDFFVKDAAATAEHDLELIVYATKAIDFTAKAVDK